MTNQRSKELLALGTSYEKYLMRYKKDDYKKMFDNYCAQTYFVAVPGGADHYVCGNLRHTDTRALFLIALGLMAEASEWYAKRTKR